MAAALIGRKIGMTRLYDDQGVNVSVTVIQVGPNFVSQIKTPGTDGYSAIQLAFEDIQARNSTMPVIGHDAKSGLAPKRVHKELRLEDGDEASFEAGQELKVDLFDDIKFVDVTGITKGRGTSGGMRRWGFKGLCATHGTERKHRSPGSVGGRASNAGTGRPKRGGKKAGQYGNKQQTIRSLKVVGSMKDKDLLLVQGAVPGPNQGLVFVREAVRLNKSKQRQAAAS